MKNCRYVLKTISTFSNQINVYLIAMPHEEILLFELNNSYYLRYSFLKYLSNEKDSRTSENLSLKHVWKEEEGLAWYNVQCLIKLNLVKPVKLTRDKDKDVLSASF